MINLPPKSENRKKNHVSLFIYKIYPFLYQEQHYTLDKNCSKITLGERSENIFPGTLSREWNLFFRKRANNDDDDDDDDPSPGGYRSHLANILRSYNERASLRFALSSRMFARRLKRELEKQQQQILASAGATPPSNSANSTAALSLPLYLLCSHTYSRARKCKFNIL